MAKINTKKLEVSGVTYEGGKAAKQTPLQELTRAVSCCMLWEDTFYESGNEIAERIKQLTEKVSMQDICDLAIRGREQLNLRHAPLWLLTSALPKKGTTYERNLLGDTIARCIQRADELAETLAMYWRDGKKPIPRQLKAGLSKAFPKFNDYQLAKYNRDEEIKLRDVMFLCHPKPKDEAQAEVWKKLVNGTLQAPDTWEVALSGGADKKTTFERLIHDRKLGYLALLRNLRNMVDAGVDSKLLEDSIRAGNKSKILPFQFLAAARFCPAMSSALSDGMIKGLEAHERLNGKTAILVDISGSMDSAISTKSKMSRIDAASAVAVIVREVCQDPRVFAYSNECHEVPNYRGIPLVDAISKACPHSNTYTGKAVAHIIKKWPTVDRIILITDEQSSDDIPAFGGLGYYINVASYKPSLPTKGGSWTRISGFSERIIDWIIEEEKSWRH